MSGKLKELKKIIDAEEYSGGILDRAQDAAISKDNEVVNDIMVASRKKGKKGNKPRKRNR